MNPEIMIRQLTRIPGFMRMWHRFRFGSVALRTEYDVWDRPNYAYGMYWAAFLARSLGIRTLSAIEFGVAGGNGLVRMERIAEAVGRHFDVDFHLFGFDTGEGMPEPTDYRDLPHVWRAGFWKMDRPRLEAVLERSELLLGPVAETVPQFLGKGHPPLGFIAFDLDYYSSTKQAFQIFDGPPSTRLPRIYCYFDDIIFPPWACHNDSVGELLAIRELNDANPRRKLARVEGLRWMRPRPARWNDQMYAFHDFDHPSYTALITPDERSERELPLRVS